MQMQKQANNVDMKAARQHAKVYARLHKVFPYYKDKQLEEFYFMLLKDAKDGSSEITVKMDGEGLHPITTIGAFKQIARIYDEEKGVFEIRKDVEELARDTFKMFLNYDADMDEIYRVAREICSNLDQINKLEDIYREFLTFERTTKKADYQREFLREYNSLLKLGSVNEKYAAAGIVVDWICMGMIEKKGSKELDFQFERYKEGRLVQIDVETLEKGRPMVVKVLRRMAKEYLYEADNMKVVVRKLTEKFFNNEHVDKDELDRTLEDDIWIKGEALYPLAKRIALEIFGKLLTGKMEARKFFGKLLEEDKGPINKREELLEKRRHETDALLIKWRGRFGEPFPIEIDPELGETGNAQRAIDYYDVMLTPTKDISDIVDVLAEGKSVGGSVAIELEASTIKSDTSESELWSKRDWLLQFTH